MINLIDFLNSCGIYLRNYKIHLATGWNPSPLEAFFDGKFQEWQEGQNNKNFECDMVLGLIQLSTEEWLFAGVYKVLGVKRGRTQNYRYQTECLPGQEELIGRIVVKYKREYRASYIWGKKYGQHLEISEIRPRKLAIEEFPGYHSVIIPYSKLRVIVENNEQTWKSALSNINGVYLVCDMSNGKLYVGSAFGEEGIWGRWTSYVRTGHGGNVELKALLKKKGDNHVRHFQYSVLEIADTHATEQYVQERETYWKNALMSRSFGYNSN
jgi:hypothetical protein